MYAAYFGLKEAPFRLTPDPTYLYLSDRHREALAHLLYGVSEDGGFVSSRGMSEQARPRSAGRFLPSFRLRSTWR